MLGKISPAILTVTVVLCCLVAMVNGLSVFSMTDDDLSKLNTLISKARCNVTLDQTEEAITMCKCIKAETKKNENLSRKECENLKTLKKLLLDETQWTAIQTCVVKEHKWDETWTADATAKDFIKNKMAFADDTIRSWFSDRIDGCIKGETDKKKLTDCGKKAFKEICLRMTEEEVKHFDI